MTGMLEWKDTGSLGRTGRRDEMGVSSSMSMISWSAWSSTWGWMRSQLGTYGSGLKGEQGQGTSYWGSATGYLTRKTKQMKASIYR